MELGIPCFAWLRIPELVQVLPQQAGDSMTSTGWGFRAPDRLGIPWPPFCFQGKRDK